MGSSKTVNLCTQKGWGLDTQILWEHRGLVAKWHMLVRAVCSKAVNSSLGLFVHVRTCLSGDTNPPLPGCTGNHQELLKVEMVTSSTRRYFAKQFTMYLAFKKHSSWPQHVSVPMIDRFLLLNYNVSILMKMEQSDSVG